MRRHLIRRLRFARRGPLPALLGVSLVVLLGLGALARAQGAGYGATAPTHPALYRDGQTDRYLVGGTWLYRADRRNVGLASRWWRDAASTDGWSAVTVPNAYNAGDFSTASANGSVGWYRRDFTLPAGAFPSYVPVGDRRWIIRFESVNYRATVWLNGRLVGRHEGSYLPFEFELHPRAGVNRLIIRVDNRRTAADLPAGWGGWWNFGGILREVYLRPVAGADLEHVEVRPLLGCPTCAARIEEQVLVHNLTGHPEAVHLRGVYGSVRLDFGSARIAPEGTWTAGARVTLRHPELWAPGHPALYRATLTLTDPSRRPLAGYQTYSGVRSIKVTRDGLLELNGRLLHLRGVDVQEQNIATGAALDPGQMIRLIGWVRELGASVIRVHYPFNPQILEMADRDGILVWSEIPAWGEKNPYLSQPHWLAKAHAALRANILTNQNHPSVLLWSIGNELPTPATRAEAAYIRGAVALAHRLDPTRPVGMAISDWPGVPCQRAYAPLQVLGFNEYFGWFDEGGGATADRSALGPFLDSLRGCYPRQAMFVTEFGFEANRDGPVDEKGTYQFQSNAAAYHLHVFASKPWLSAALYWVLQDYAAWPGWGGGDPRPDPPFVQKGLVDLFGNLKPAFSVVSRIYHSTRQIAPTARGG